MTEIIVYVGIIIVLLLMIAAITFIQKKFVAGYDPVLEYRKGYILKPVGDPVDDFDIGAIKSRKELREHLYKEYQKYGELKSKPGTPFW